MNKFKFIKLLALGLLLCNLTLITFLFISRSGPKGPKMELKYRIIKDLKLDEVQKMTYEKLIEKHREFIKSEGDNVRRLKDEILKNIGADGDLKIQDSLLMILSETQLLIEKKHIEHFTEIKRICRKDQLPKFLSLMEDMGDMMGPRHKHRHKRKPKH